MAGGFSLQAAWAGTLAAIVGFTSSFPVVLEGLRAVGATSTQAASGLMALSVALGLCSLVLSLWTRMPVTAAWSTPGAALLVASGVQAGGFATAVGAFVIAGLLVCLAALWHPLGRMVSAIPSAIANAMLAGVLFGLCIAPVAAIVEMPLAALSIVTAWAVVARFNRLLAVPAAVIVAIGFVAATAPAGSGTLAWWPQPEFVAPVFTLPAAIGIAVPLFLVTMASQNIPGLAVLNANGYRPPTGPLLAMTGLSSVAAAPFGGHAVNLAAITAAICAGEDAQPDPARRYWAGVAGGTVYLVLGPFVGAMSAWIAGASPVLIAAGAGLALLGPFAGAVAAAMVDPADREAAVVTFIVTASGISFFGIGGAFWGLLAGGAIYALSRWSRARA